MRRHLSFRSLALAAVLGVPAAVEAQGVRVRTGIEVLLSDSLHLIRGKRVGLITNHTGVGPMGKSTVDLLHSAPNVRLTALYGPEHGIRGVARAGDKIASSVDSATGVPVHSLYGDTRVPTADMVKDVDVLIFDIQEVGARVYTYPWTMALAAEAAKKPFIVLDRPNLIRNDRVEGGVLDPNFRSFVGQYPVAMRYGMTIGELATWLVTSGQLKADVTVIPMQNYKPGLWWNETGLGWVNPSPNIRSGDAALLYTGTVFFEGTNVSEGRGTMMPFQMIGASWLTDAGAIVRELNAKNIPGVVFDSASQTIEAGYKFGGEKIPVILVVVADRELVRPHVVGLHLLRAIYKRHPNDFKWRESAIDRLSGSDRLRKAVEREGGIEELIPILDRESMEFAARIERIRLYR
ncbi:MAG: exo-beta-N-acetylmuramidase NamZ family protein [Gemmatimonadaceae bacterium]